MSHQTGLGKGTAQILTEVSSFTMSGFQSCVQKYGIPTCECLCPTDMANLLRSGWIDPLDLLF